MYKLESLLLLAAVCAVVVNCFPNPEHCRPHQTEAIKQKYIKKLWDEAEDLEDIDELLVEIRIKVQRKLKELDKKVDFVIEFAEQHGFDIKQCLDFEYINHIPVEVKQRLNKLYGSIEDGSSDLVAYVRRSINLIHGCGGLHVSCRKIERCCNTVVENFDDDVIEDGVEEIEEDSERTLRSILRKIDDDIKNIQETTDLCYLEHQQSTTTEEPVVTTEPVQETTTEEAVVTTEKPVETTEPVQETTTEEAVETTESIIETTTDNGIIEPSPE